MGQPISHYVKLAAAAIYLPNMIVEKRTFFQKALLFLIVSVVPYALILPINSLMLEPWSTSVNATIGDKDLDKYGSLVVNESISTEYTSTSVYATESTTNTILPRAMLPPRHQLRRCDIGSDQAGNAYTSVAYEFVTNDWLPAMLPFGTELGDAFVVPGASRRSMFNSMMTDLSAENASLFDPLLTRAAYLYVDAVSMRDAGINGGHGAALEQLKNDTRAYYAANDLTSSNTTNASQHVEDYTRSYFAQATAWATLLRAKSSDIVVDLTFHRITDIISFAAVTLDIPLDNEIWHRELSEVNGELVDGQTPWSCTGDIVYEFDVAKECGPLTCGIQNRGLASEPQVVVYAACASDELDCNEHIRPDAMWLFGFGRRIEGDAIDLGEEPSKPSLRKAIMRNPRAFHVLPWDC